MINELNAVTLTVSDMERSVAFYTSLGFVIEHGGPESNFTTFRVGRQALNLMAGAAERVAGWGRIIFWVEDVDAIHGLTLSKGLTPETEPSDAPWGERYFHLDDPDGHQLSFARPLDP